MHISPEPYRFPAEGELRTLSGFLWLPVTITGETRWLERAQYVQRCQYNEAAFGWTEPYDWIDERWVD